MSGVGISDGEVVEMLVSTALMLASESLGGECTGEEPADEAQEKESPPATR